MRSNQEILKEFNAQRMRAKARRKKLLFLFVLIGFLSFGGLWIFNLIATAPEWMVAKWTATFIIGKKVGHKAFSLRGN